MPSAIHSSSSKQASRGSSKVDELKFDENNRIRFEGRLTFDTQKYVISSIEGRSIGESLFDIKTHCLEVFNCRNTVSSDSYSAGATFFIRASEEPRCFLEKLALDIFSLHTKDVCVSSFDAANSGAEWWTQVINPDDEIGFHWLVSN